MTTDPIEGQRGLLVTGRDPARQVITLRHGQPQYTDLLDQIRADPALVARMWADAESTPDEIDQPGTWWTVTLVHAGRRWEPAAWCAAHIDGDTLKCHSNYEHPCWRGLGLYEAAYRERHRTVLTATHLPAVTYLYIDPIRLHEADGWRWTGLSGTSPETGHDWWELRRPAPRHHTTK